MAKNKNLRTGGEILVDQLLLNHVDTVFMVPGESYLAALDALYGARNQTRVITCRHVDELGRYVDQLARYVDELQRYENKLGQCAMS